MQTRVRARKDRWNEGVGTMEHGHLYRNYRDVRVCAYFFFFLDVYNFD